MRWGVDVMNLSLRGWITALGLVGCLACADVSSGAWADDPPSTAKVEAGTADADKAKGAKSTDAKPKEATTGDKPAEPPASEQPASDGLAAEKAAAEHAPSPSAEAPAAKAGEAAHGDDKSGEAKSGDHGAHAEAHGHHDPTDLSHANDGPGHLNVAPRALTGIQELKADLAIYTFGVFLLLMVVLLKFGWKPIMAGLEKREQSIRDLIAQTERNAAAAEASLRQHQAKLAAATEEAREVLVQARRESEQMRATIVAEARTAAQRERDRALEDIAAAKNVALREIAQSSVNTAVGLAGRILQREVSAADHAQLIREALDKFPNRN